MQWLESKVSINADLKRKTFSGFIMIYKSKQS